MKKMTLVFAGPSAVGKTYAANELMRLHPDTFEQAKLYTTRTKRTGENSTDRVFITDIEFNKMIENKLFIIHDSFGGNRYGFTKDSIYPNKKHLIVNAWPWLVEELSTLSHVLIVGLQAPDDWEKLLVERMKTRGDSEDTIEIRKKLIAKDKLDLEKNSGYVKKSGKLFVINNSDTIPSIVLPWIQKKLSL